MPNLLPQSLENLWDRRAQVGRLLKEFGHGTLSMGRVAGPYTRWQKTGSVDELVEVARKPDGSVGRARALAVLAVTMMPEETEAALEVLEALREAGHSLPSSLLDHWWPSLCADARLFLRKKGLEGEGEPEVVRQLESRLSESSTWSNVQTTQMFAVRVFEWAVLGEEVENPFSQTGYEELEKLVAMTPAAARQPDLRQFLLRADPNDYAPFMIAHASPAHTSELVEQVGHQLDDWSWAYLLCRASSDHLSELSDQQVQDLLSRGGTRTRKLLLRRLNETTHPSWTERMTRVWREYRTIPPGRSPLRPEALAVRQFKEDGGGDKPDGE